MATTTDIMEKIVALCRRRGFIFGSSEIYGGIGGFWDYGPLGTELKRNIKDAWWNDMIRNPPVGPNDKEYQMVGLDCSIIMNPKVWEASGHLGGFSDKMVACKTEGCKRLFRADKVFCAKIVPPDYFGDDTANKLETHGSCTPTSPQLPTPERLAAMRNVAIEADDFRGAHSKLQDVVRANAKKSNDAPFKKFKAEPLADQVFGRVVAVRDGNGVLYACEITNLAYEMLTPPYTCPACGGELTEPREFNLMFKTPVGAAASEEDIAYLRPETAQGIFANFKNVIDSTRVKLPFGIGQIGKAFRNEINPRNYTFRSREFEQMEIEFFCHPSEADKWYEYWRDLRFQWCVGLGLKSDKLHLRDHDPDELAHYAKGCADVEYEFPFGVSELEGIANRTDYDLNAHKTASGKDLSYFDIERKERFIPYVIEPSAGVDRFALAIICEAYSHDPDRASPEFMKFHPRLAPIKAAVFPLVAKDGLPDIAEPIHREIKKSYPCQYDAKQSIGKRYARMDEAGTPFCFTIDGQTREDGTVTVRDRDDASQIRIDKSRCAEYLREKLAL